MQLIQFLFLIGVSCLLFMFLFSGVIGYFFYSLSHGAPPLEVTTPTLLHWENLPKVSKKTLLPAITMLTALWVLIGSGESKKEDDKSGKSKGRTRRRHQDED